MSDEVISKTAFAAVVGVSPPRVTQWISAGQIDGHALVGSGRWAKIHVARAIEQLNERLDVNHRVSAVAKAKLDGIIASVPLHPIISEAALTQLASKLASAMLQVLRHEFTIAEPVVASTEQKTKQ